MTTKQSRGPDKMDIKDAFELVITMFKEQQEELQAYRAALPKVRETLDLIACDIPDTINTTETEKEMCRAGKEALALLDEVLK